MSATNQLSLALIEIKIEVDGKLDLGSTYTESNIKKTLRKNIDLRNTVALAHGVLDRFRVRGNLANKLPPNHNLTSPGEVVNFESLF